MTGHRIKATVSGSFRRAMRAVEEAVYALTDAGVTVLSPADPRVVDQFGDFLFVASDRARTIKHVQSRHLAAVEASDFLWVVAPQGYIGQSAAMEIGYAVAVGTPVFCSEVPVDLTLRQYVTTLKGPEEAARRFLAGSQQSAPVPSEPTNVLLDPIVALDAAHADLEVIGEVLTRPGDPLNREAEGAVSRLERSVTRPLRAD